MSSIRYGHHGPEHFQPYTSRRDFLKRAGLGVGMISLADLLGSEAVANRSGLHPMAPRPPHFAPRAKRVIHFFMNGGPSHVDTFDPKPALEKYDGKKLPGGNLDTERETGAAMASPFTFRPRGDSGIAVSDLFERTAENIDDIAVIRSMHAERPNHEPSLMLMNCGMQLQVRPSVGSWVTYGLGTENQNLPGFVVLCPGGFPVKGPQNWTSAFLPGIYQGTHIDSSHTDVEKLIQNIRNPHLSRKEQRRQLDLVQQLNRHHREERPHDKELDARIQSMELAYRMQQEATDAFDISREPEGVREMYGDTVQARQTLMARRLVERGVRYVQVWHGAGQPWDSHHDIAKNHRKLAGDCDQPIGALLKDLKQRGLLEDTLVIWGGEFGRTPAVELSQAGKSKQGRDHNHYGFTVWMAGGGVKRGVVHGATDEFGFKAVEKPVHVHDLHATLLHLLGFDHKELTYRYAGRDFRLTDVHGHVIDDVLA